MHAALVCALSLTFQKATLSSKCSLVPFKGNCVLPAFLLLFFAFSSPLSHPTLAPLLPLFFFFYPPLFFFYPPPPSQQQKKRNEGGGGRGGGEKGRAVIGKRLLQGFSASSVYTTARGIRAGWYRSILFYFISISFFSFFFLRIRSPGT